jgi:transcriptional regulator
MEKLKEAFLNVRRDVSYLFREIEYIKNDFVNLNNQLKEFTFKFNKISQEQEDLLNKILLLSEKLNLNLQPNVNKEDIKTESSLQMANLNELTSKNTIFKGQIPKNLGISTGNGGVQTDRQTDRQTDILEGNNKKNTFEEAFNLVKSLNHVKSEISNKLRKLTDQEKLVFLTIYQLNEEGLKVNYRLLAVKLSLTESSIRDYVKRLITKGIPLEKVKVNNKEIHLSISNSLKETISLNTLLNFNYK